jgi:hypothetical protein
MKHIFNIKDDIYNSTIKLFVGSNKQFDSYVQKHLTYDNWQSNKKAEGGLCSFEEEKTKRMLYIVWIEKVPQCIYDASIIGHEVNHLTFRVMEDVNIKAEEAHCYYHDYIFKQIATIIAEELQNGKSKK